jgi:type III pantothenate kinase
MELVIDIGNNYTKSALFHNGKITQQVIDDKGRMDNMYLLTKDAVVQSAIVSSVRPIGEELRDFLSAYDVLIHLSHETPLPIVLDYDTPSTLGRDRIAGVVGSTSLFPNQNTLVIDAGTCITYDFIDAEGTYRGGSISPGLSMRYQSLNNFTGALPLVEHQDPNMLVGKSTEDSIRTGVFNGMVNEINGTIRRYKLEKSPLNLVICGGDAKKLLSGMEEEAIHEHDLVLIGLHKILIYNALQKNL